MYAAKPRDGIFTESDNSIFPSFAIERFEDFRLYCFVITPNAAM
jgi:hypothetical protein